jgi:hypothetical protein
MAARLGAIKAEKFAVGDVWLTTEPPERSPCRCAGETSVVPKCVPGTATSVPIWHNPQARVRIEQA